MKRKEGTLLRWSTSKDSERLEKKLLNRIRNKDTNWEGGAVIIPKIKNFLRWLTTKDLERLEKKVFNRIRNIDTNREGVEVPIINEFINQELKRL